MTILDDSLKHFFLNPAITDITVIGAGVAGLSVAHQMAQQGYSVRCIEKARGTGGRLSSKRLNLSRDNSSARFHPLLDQTEHDQLQLSADLGCSQFELTEEQAHYQSLIRLNTKDPMHSTAEYVAVPRNSALTRELTAGVEMAFSTRVTRIEYKDGMWQCHHETDHQQEQLLCASKQLVIAAPAPQAAMLLPDTPAYRDIKQHVTDVMMEPQWVAIMALASAISKDKSTLYMPDLSKEILAKHKSFLSFVGREDTKPQRTQQPDISIWKIETSAQWSFEHQDLPKDVIAKKIQAELKRIITAVDPNRSGSSLDDLMDAINDAYTHCHRWLYSTAETQTRISGMAFWQHQQLALCGDYFAETLSHNTQLKGVSASLKSAHLLVESLLAEMAA